MVVAIIGVFDSIKSAELAKATLIGAGVPEGRITIDVPKPTGACQMSVNAQSSLERERVWDLLQRAGACGTEQRPGQKTRCTIPCMRKRLIAPVRQGTSLQDHGWLDVEDLAEVEVTSEDAAYPVEHALLPGEGSGWRAGRPGTQTIRLVFAAPQRLQRIRLKFDESIAERTQEYVLRWSADGGRSFRDIARQQWNFSPRGATSETEEHRVELRGVTVLELSITPDISDPGAFASLAQWRVA